MDMEQPGRPHAPYTGRSVTAWDGMYNVMEDSQGPEAPRPCGTNDPQHDYGHNSIHTNNYEQALNNELSDSSTDSDRELCVGKCQSDYCPRRYSPWHN